MPLVEYMNIFEELKSQCKLKIQSKLYSSKKKKKKKKKNDLIQYLRLKFVAKLITHWTLTIYEAFQLTLKIKHHLKQPLTRRFPSLAGETPLRRFNSRASTMQP